ncbi:hypothetical protein Hanom_Chr10g00880741 [Helianthus anomalus]
MHPFRHPFGVPSRPGNPNTTQPQQDFNFRDMDQNVFSYAAYLSGSNPFIPTTYGFAPPGASQPSQEQAEPEVDTVPETQPEPDRETSKRGRRSHKKRTRTLLVVSIVTLFGRRTRNTRWFEHGSMFRRTLMWVSVIKLRVEFIIFLTYHLFFYFI